MKLIFDGRIKQYVNEPQTCSLCKSQFIYDEIDIGIDLESWKDVINCPVCEQVINIPPIFN